MAEPRYLYRRPMSRSDSKLCIVCASSGLSASRNICSKYRDQRVEGELKEIYYSMHYFDCMLQIL